MDDLDIRGRLDASAGRVLRVLARLCIAVALATVITIGPMMFGWRFVPRWFFLPAKAAAGLCPEDTTGMMISACAFWTGVTANVASWSTIGFVLITTAGAALTRRRAART